MFTESLLLAVISALAGLTVAWWGSRLLLALVADGAASLAIDVRLDLPVLAFTIVVTIAAVALFGLAPALRATRVDLATVMRATGRSLTGGLGARGNRFPLGKLLVAGQVGLSVVLLAGAALLVRDLRSVQSVDVGLDRDHLVIVDVDAVGRGYVDDRRAPLVRELAARFARLPGVADVSYSANGIFSGSENDANIQVAGFTPRTAADSSAYYDNVGPGYFRAIGSRVTAGREFTDADGRGAAPVAVVNETMARAVFPGGSPLGQTIRLDSVTVLTIVGVAADTKDHDLTGAPLRRFYTPYLQNIQGDPGSLRFEVRTRGDPAGLVNPVRRELRAVDPLLADDPVDPLALLMRQSVREGRLLTRLATAFGVLALLLAAVGLYGVMTYAITRRTGEIGLRVALGAQRSDVIRMVLGDALRVVAIGAGIGVPLALASARFLRSQLHGVESTDPVSIAVALAVLTASALVAAFLPAMRAARVTPVEALRED